MENKIAVHSFMICFIFLTTLSRSDAQNQKKLETMARDTVNDVFIIYNNDSLVKYSSIRMKTPIWGYETIYADGKEVPKKNIKVFQTSKFYAVRVVDDDNLGKWRMNVTDYFATRIKRGKINLYVQYLRASNYNGIRNGVTTATGEFQYFIQSGNNGPVFHYTRYKLEQAVLDNKIVSEKLSKIKSVTTDDLKELIDEYNRN